MTSAAPAGIKRFVYKRLVAGDYKKLRAESNDGSRDAGGDKSGGGARDLRFTAKLYEPVFAEMFPQQETRSNGCVVHYTDHLHYWTASRALAECKAEFWGPTKSRPTEARLSKINNTPAFDVDLVPSHPDVYLLIFQADQTYACYVTEDDLRDKGWHPSVKNPILKNHAGASADDPNVRGFVDFETGSSDHRND